MALVRSTPCHTKRYRTLPAISKAFQNHSVRYFQLFNNVPCFPGAYRKRRCLRLIT